MPIDYEKWIELTQKHIQRFYSGEYTAKECFDNTMFHAWAVEQNATQMPGENPEHGEEIPDSIPRKK